MPVQLLAGPAGRAGWLPAPSGHRLRAAVANGQEAVDVRYFDGSAADAFLRAVEANVKHGLPLSLADRRAAAQRRRGS
jgi:hypothetical protein